MQQDTTQHIDHLIRARYPIVAVQSHEERRVIGALVRIADRQEKTLYTWAISTGVAQVFPTDTSASSDESLADPVAALRHVLDLGTPTAEQPAGPRAIFVFKDLHRYLEDPVVVRLLRDLACELPMRHQTLVLLSPTFTVPPDLEKDVTLVDFPLPGPSELTDLLDQFADDLIDQSSAAVDLNGNTETIVRALQGLSLIEAEAVLG